MARVSRSGDSCAVHECSAPSLTGGSPVVRADGIPVHRQGDPTTVHTIFGPEGDCSPPAFHASAVARGSSVVMVDGRPASIVGSPLVGCSSVTGGSPVVRVSD